MFKFGCLTSLKTNQRLSVRVNQRSWNQPREPEESRHFFLRIISERTCNKLSFGEYFCDIPLFQQKTKFYSADKARCLYIMFSRVLNMSQDRFSRLIPSVKKHRQPQALVFPKDLRLKIISITKCIF